MTYTNTWSVATPANSDSASNSAADMRKIRVDVEERFETLIGSGGMDTDPITVLSTSYKQYIHWSEFNPYSTSGATALTAASGSKYGLTSSNNVNLVFYAPVNLPRGVTITELILHGYVTATTTIAATLESIDATTSTVTQSTLATASIAVLPASQGQYSSGTVSVTLDTTAANYIFYYIKLAVTSSGTTNNMGIQGIEIVYTKDKLARSL